MQIDKFWNRYREQDSEAPAEPPEAWAFGNTPEMANELLAYVCSGRKTATCSLHMLYEREGEDLPKVGEYNIILDGAGLPRAVTKQTSVEVEPFNEVSEDFARAEGEGDLSYEYWHRVHVDFFTEILKTYGETFEPSMNVVCERFKVCMTC